MKIRIPLFCMLSFILISCGDQAKTSKSSSTEVADQKNPITAKTIENLNYSDYALSSNAERIVEEWEKYQELSIQVSYLKKADLSFFNGEQKLLKDFIKEFKAKIPDTLQTNPIISRTTVIETSLLRLNENLILDNIDDNLKLESIEGVLEAFSNLNYQINKKLVRDKNEKIKSQY